MLFCCHYWESLCATNHAAALQLTRARTEVVEGLLNTCALHSLPHDTALYLTCAHGLQHSGGWVRC